VLTSPHMESPRSHEGLAGGRVLVTGGYGFVGQAVTRALAAAGAQVTCLYRPGSRPIRDLPGTLLAGDARDPALLSAALDGVDFVVHLAARSGGIQFQEASHIEVFTENHGLTSAVLSTAARAGVRRVFLASSATVYRDQTAELLAESAPLVMPGVDQVSGYAWSKLTDEALGGWHARQGDFEVVIGRFTNVYGPGGSFESDRSTVIHALVRRAVETPPGGWLVVWGDGSPVRSFIYIDDAASAVLDVLLHGVSGEAYNIDSSEPVTIAELAEMIRHALGGELSVQFDPSQPSGMPRRVLDTRKLRTLGCQPLTPLSMGVRGTVAHYRELSGLPEEGRFTAGVG